MLPFWSEPNKCICIKEKGEKKETVCMCLESTLHLRPAVDTAAAWPVTYATASYAPREPEAGGLAAHLLPALRSATVTHISPTRSDLTIERRQMIVVQALLFLLLASACNAWTAAGCRSVTNWGTTVCTTSPGFGIKLYTSIILTRPLLSRSQRRLQSRA